ncbi:hypothetical protein [Leifsonia aquatica]|uniref:hypothetical protein n=1 Tax=Leifsonia aquatica TaxID=144185 RepID=UPI00381B2DD9
MTDAPEITTALMRGLAEDLAGAGLVRYAPGGGYPRDPAEHDEDASTFLPPAVQFQQMLADPPRSVSISFYDITSPADTTATAVSLQLRIRLGWEPLEGIDLLTALSRRLHQRQHAQLGNVHVSFIRRLSAGPMGPDEQGRPEFTSNYRFTGLSLTG